MVVVGDKISRATTMEGTSPAPGVPNPNSAVGGTAREYGPFRRTPLDILHTALKGELGISFKIECRTS